MARHRVVWDHGPLGPPVQPREEGLPRATVRMVRPNLSALSSAAPVEAPVDSVVEMAPITARVPNAPQRPDSSKPLPNPPPGQAGTAEPQPPTEVTAMLIVPREPNPATALVPLAPPPVVRPTLRTIDPRLVMLSSPDSARASSFRLLRDNLLAKGLPRVLAVSSAAPHDGKTTCALNLALALAEHTPARILLMDGNFFAPSLGSIFAVDEYTPSPSVVDPVRLAPYKLAELTPSLHVATIVVRRGEAPPRFDKQRFDVLLDLLCRVGYDHIIVDAPAIGGSPMVSQLLGGVDGVLLAVRSGRTTARELRRAVEDIPGNKGLGIALIDAEPQV